MVLKKSLILLGFNQEIYGLVSFVGLQPFWACLFVKGKIKPKHRFFKLLKMKVSCRLMNGKAKKVTFYRS